MAVMATVPVFACRRCGKPVYVTHLSTSEADPNAEQLRLFMANLEKIALCKECLAAYNFLASQNRADEFLINPHIIIYNVRDNSGVDYYGREG